MSHLAGKWASCKDKRPHPCLGFTAFHCKATQGAEAPWKKGSEVAPRFSHQPDDAPHWQEPITLLPPRCRKPGAVPPFSAFP